MQCFSDPWPVAERKGETERKNKRSRERKQERKRESCKYSLSQPWSERHVSTGEWSERCNVNDFEDGGSGHESRNAGSI